MIYKIWIRIAYMVQLIAACLIFMAPARKRKNYIWRMGICAAGLLLLSYVVNTVYPQGLEEVQSKIGAVSICYWAFYLLAAIVFVRSGLESSLTGVIYCAVCACTMQHIAYDFCVIYRLFWERETWRSWLVYLVIYGLVYAVGHEFLVDKLMERGRFVVSRQSLFPVMTIIVLVWGLSVLERSSMPGFEGDVGNHLLYRIMEILCCYYVLWGERSQHEKVRLQRELDGINNAWRQQTRQYQVTTETIDSINRKCHDLKHQIRALRHMEDEEEREEFFNELESAIMIYDTALKTGNKALDTVLMDKGLFCKNHNIQWSCMADGSRLDFMKLEDIYAIFGNALDNAIEAVMELEEEEKRIISVKIITQNDLVAVQIQNYYDKELKFQEGIPVTTKKNKRDHGFGMKSIRYTAEKYNGTITVQAKDHIFMLQILLPVRQSA